MKHSHTTTPRTLSECSFVCGYASIEPIADRKNRLKDIAWAIAGIACFAAIGAMLAWRG